MSFLIDLSVACPFITLTNSILYNAAQTNVQEISQFYVITFWQIIRWIQQLTRDSQFVGKVFFAANVVKNVYFTDQNQFFLSKTEITYRR